MAALATELRIGGEWTAATGAVAAGIGRIGSRFQITAAGAAEFVVSGGSFGDLEKPVTSAAALTDGPGFALGTFTVES